MYYNRMRYTVFDRVTFGMRHILLPFCVLFWWEECFHCLKSNICDKTTQLWSLCTLRWNRMVDKCEITKLQMKYCDAVWFHQCARILNYTLCKRACVIRVCETCDSQAMQLQLMWNNRTEYLRTICKTFVVWTLY